MKMTPFLTGMMEDEEMIFLGRGGDASASKMSAK